MEKTTIAISKELKDKIATFGNKGESFENILSKLYNSAVDRQLNDFLFNEEGFVSLDDFEREVNDKWPKSK
jgi:hypothetical protein